MGYNNENNTEALVAMQNFQLPDTMSEKQKESKVRNLLSSLRIEGTITPDSDNKRLVNTAAQVGQ